MRVYNLNDVFEILDKDFYYSMYKEAIAFQVIDKFKTKKKGKNVLNYKVRFFWGPVTDLNRWRFNFPDNEAVYNRYVLGELLRKNQIRKISDDEAALLLLKAEVLEDRYEVK